MKKTLFIALFLVADLITSTAWASDASQGLTACRKHYQSQKDRLDGAWTFVSGIKGKRTYCFWAWDSDAVISSTAQAKSKGKAMSRCMANGYRCFVFADYYTGLKPWVRKEARRQA